METNSITCGLIIATKIRDGLPITNDRVETDKGGQVRGLSGEHVSRLLVKHGIDKPFTSEGGRTSRGSLGKAKSYVEVVNDFEIPDDFPLEDLALSLEKFFVGKILQDYFAKKLIEVSLDPLNSVASTVAKILDEASSRADKPTGVVLQHLVGAKLELRFPDEYIGRDKATTADQQTQRNGDFQVGTTAFHVTVSPMEKLIERCKDNLSNGLRPVILTPANRVVAAIQLSQIHGAENRIGVLEAESFIGTNIEEIAIFDSDKIKEGLARLIRRYNERIRDVETDPSLAIQEPTWITSLLDSLNS